MKRYGRKEIIQLMKSNKNVMIRYDFFEDKANVVIYNSNDIDIKVGYITYDLFHSLRQENEIDYIIKGYRFSYWRGYYGKL